jgi:hypothetical protein
VYFDELLQYSGNADVQNQLLGLYTQYTLSIPSLYMDTGYYCILQAVENAPYKQKEQKILWS